MTLRAQLLSTSEPEIKLSTSNNSRPGLFDRKLEGPKLDSPDNIKRAYQQLFQTLGKLSQLPPSIRQQLDLSHLNQLDFEQLEKDLNAVIADEAWYRRFKGAVLGAGLLIGGIFAIRALAAGLFYLMQELAPVPCFTPQEMACFGWDCSKWPALIFSSITSTIGTIMSCCTKSDTEQNLENIQKLINQSVDEIKKLENVIHLTKNEEHIELSPELSAAQKIVNCLKS